MSYNDTVQFISKHIKFEGVELKHKAKDRDKLINICLSEYHTTDDESRKKELRDCILLNIWYLFPYVLSQYKLKGNIFEDTLQLMILTAMKAIENYNPSLGYKFSSYISGYLKDAISTSLRSNMVVKCPPAVAKTQEIFHLTPVVEDEENLLKKRKKRDKYVELNIEEDITLTDISKDIVNKNKPTGLCEYTVEEQIIDNEYTELLRAAINKKGLLTNKERIVLVYRFGLSGVPRLTLSQVAGIFRQHGNRASKVWIFQIEQKAKAKLFRYFKRNNLC